MARAATVGLIVGAVVAAFAAGWLTRDAQAPGADALDFADDITIGAMPPRDVPRPPPLDTSTRNDQASESRPPAPQSPLRGATPPGAARDPSTEPRTRVEPARTSHRAAAPGPTTVAGFEVAIAAAYDARHPAGLRPTATDLEWAASLAKRVVDVRLEAWASAAQEGIDEQVRRLKAELALRKARGILADGPAVLELRARGVSDIVGTAVPGPLRGDGFDPFAVPSASRDDVGVTGGVLVPGRTFVVERVEIETAVGRSVDEPGSVRVASPEMSFATDGAGRRFRATFVGSQSVSNLALLGLTVKGAAARVRFVGRVVPTDAAEESRRFEFIPDGSEGFLRTAAPVRIQLCAREVHDGSPRTVDLAGGDHGYFLPPSPGPNWVELTGLKKWPSSSKWTENAGLVPPGYVFHLERIEWRVRLAEERSRFEIACAAEKRPLVNCEGGDSPNVPRDSNGIELRTGTWTGDVVIAPGSEPTLTFACHGFGMADVTVHGRVDRAAR